MTTIYIVRGDSGEHSDFQDWLVMAYRTEKEANTHRDRANAWAKENECACYPFGHNVSHAMNPDRPRKKIGKNPFDPKMIVQDGVGYEVISVHAASNLEFKNDRRIVMDCEVCKKNKGRTLIRREGLKVWICESCYQEGAKETQ